MIAAALELLFPPSCLACHAPLGPRRSVDGPLTLLCAECGSDLQPLERDRSCPCCGSFPFRRDDELTPPGQCVDCALLPRSFVDTCSAFPYDSAAGDMIRHMKYRSAPFVAGHLVRLAVPHVAEWLRALPAETVLAPVPMPVRREFFRGYNQARELARALGGEFGMDLLSEDALVRTRWKKPQARFHTHAERHENLRNAFVVRRPAEVEGHSLLVVDDVMTSGATAAYTAQALMAAGAHQVRLFSIVRAPLADRDQSLPEELCP